MNKYLDYNGDGKFDHDDIFDFIKNLIHMQTKNNIVDGAGKKLNVINQVKNIMTKDEYDRYAPLIEISIDFIYSQFYKNKCLKKMWCC
jgi:hypothetical protein